MMQTFDFVRPPDNPYLAPLGRDFRVMALCFGEHGDLYSKSHRLPEIFERVGARQRLYPVPGLDAPIGELFNQFGKFVITHLGGVGTARRTALPEEFCHVTGLVQVDGQSNEIIISFIDLGVLFHFRR